MEEIESFAFPRNMVEENEELNASGTPDFTKFL